MAHDGCLIVLASIVLIASASVGLLDAKVDTQLVLVQIVL